MLKQSRLSAFILVKKPVLKLSFPYSGNKEHTIEQQAITDVLDKFLF